ncbi:hypothetical protein [Streptomyces sp. NPDC048419]|uniref:hypothetical protein n=1 Tax=Streptomyces sp. NPDC048419 TaxID=3365547 RepID=UPI003711A3FF
MDGAQTGRRGVSRLPAVCALLFGLFLMHGAPATAAEGCHGAMTAVADSTMTATAGTVTAGTTMIGGHHAVMTSPAPPVVHDSGPTVRGADVSGMPGTLCVSTPAHDRVPLPAPGLLALAGSVALVLWGLARLRAAAGGTGRRGPPAGGRDLLLQVCVART